MTSFRADDAADVVVVASVEETPADWQAVDPLPPPPPDDEDEDEDDATPQFPSLSQLPLDGDTTVEFPRVVTTTADSNKRPSVAPLDHRPKKKRATPLQQLKKVVFNVQMTAQVMLWFQECKEQGLFNSSKKKDYGPAFETVVERCQQAWPQFPWSKKTIAAKYDTERRRYQAFKMLMEGFSGVTYNYDTGLPDASETTWESFLSKNNTKHRDFGWLRRIPLGDRDVYEVVFWRERAAGLDIVEAGDVQEGETQDDDASGCDITALLDSDNDDSDVFGGSTTSSATVSRPVPRRLTAAQRHRLETDPDQTPPRNNDPPIIINNRSRKRARNTDPLGETLFEAAVVMAAPKLPGADALELAIEDIQRLFAETSSAEEIANCCEYLQNNPMRAVGWMKLGLAVKAVYIERWKVGG
ncbi:hypothetical protein C8A05DRAFT_18127 [Staphylotrichum tortipilum]|uniref:Myb/SANT-like domain-containing protein n=1 Tax=Staphylotrichum tortipilum TaxID=2831512 RepID=A0AAN6MG24_9PEZI|nr:hypothetical protein C8A05DRAFT_18127 [Staphylotrichum longicolle]